MKDFLRVFSYAGNNRPLMTKAIIYLSLSMLCAVAPFFIVSLVGWEIGGEAQ
jgi:hypothetical protein